MSSIEKLLEVMARLRDRETGCPWDREQDFSTIAPYTVEEAYEVADAIARGDMPGLRDELGDLLFQVVFHARMAEEAGAFDFDDVAAGITGKMLRRHPHVFGTAEERSRGAVPGAWERIKAEERERVNGGGPQAGALEGIALALPALKRAQKLGRRAARVGFDWPDAAGPRDKIAEELAELDEALAELHKGLADPGNVRADPGDERNDREERADPGDERADREERADPGDERTDRGEGRTRLHEELSASGDARGSGEAGRVAEEFGDLLFAAVNLARHLGIDAEQALSDANRKFERRFRALEKAVRADGKALEDLPLETLEAYWQSNK